MLTRRMRCLCPQECTCGTPEVAVRADILAFAEQVRERERERFARYGGLEYNSRMVIDTTKSYAAKKPNLRECIWVLITALCTLDANGLLDKSTDLLSFVKHIFIVVRAYEARRLAADHTEVLLCCASSYDLKDQAEACFYFAIIGQLLRYHPTVLPILMKERKWAEQLLDAQPPFITNPELRFGEYVKAWTRKKRAGFPERDKAFFRILALQLCSPY